MSEVDLYLVTYGNGHAVVMDGADARERAGFSVSRGLSVREDREGGVFVLTPQDDPRPILYEPVSVEAPEALRFQERVSDDGVGWESAGVVPASQAVRTCARTVNRSAGRLVYLKSGAMALIVGRRQCLRYEPVRDAARGGMLPGSASGRPVRREGRGGHV
ncbi:hypothetical protein [Streptomyces sp. NPDC018055]|uniref:hypothetical protein n=1 Tax=Streptomyces sp. NPDC018055 TaxID=3365038 RepID=UPI0037987352